MINFRKHTPKRVYNGENLGKYTKYKDILSTDFFERCGYCNTHHKYFCGKKYFQIDHFKPKSIQEFAHLEHEYNNLVYSCPMCNRAKWNYWNFEGPNFIDPTEDIYTELFKRQINGKIIINPSLDNKLMEDAKYIFKKLKFFLKIKELNSLLDILTYLIGELRIKYQDTNDTEIKLFMYELFNYREKINLEYEKQL